MHTDRQTDRQTDSEVSYMAIKLWHFVFYSTRPRTAPSLASFENVAKFVGKNIIYDNNYEESQPLGET